jgi:hypothetical protein
MIVLVIEKKPTILVVKKICAIKEFVDKRHKKIRHLVKCRMRGSAKNDLFPYVGWQQFS